jgi:hypothetical protein
VTEHPAGEGPPESTLWIESTRTAPGSDLPSACLIRWRGESWYASVEDVRATAIDMIECAVYANTMLMMLGLGLPAKELSGFFGDMLHQVRGGRPFGLPSTVGLTPAGSSKRKLAVVLIGRDGRQGEVGSDAAITMARQWLEVAAGVGSDQVVVAALRALKTPADLETLVFGKMRELRTAGGG